MLGPVYIRTCTKFKFHIQRPSIRFKPGYKKAGISQIFLYLLWVGIKAVIKLPRTKKLLQKCLFINI